MAKPLDLSIHIGQKLLDRIIFVAFCEDRDLLPAECLNQAYHFLPPFRQVTNPRWRNFLDLFRSVDEGIEGDSRFDKGYNGGLFRHDPEVDDLQLDDSWTSFFRNVGTFDFRDEVNVEVLGRLFERSIGELERLRATGLFGTGFGDAKAKPPTMPKSPERKRFGIYYTPPEFTRFIVNRTVGTVVHERLEQVRQRHKLTAEDLRTDQTTPALEAFWREAINELRSIKVCDPACGSGAFLVQAYDLLEERYVEAVEHLRPYDGESIEKIYDGIPDFILTDNLHGVDLSEQAVEITQLALWIRSTRRNQRLSDLSENIVCGNSLVADPGVHPRAMTWKESFPAVFDRPGSGFDCVIGNPPWERMKVQEREFFALAAPEIAGAVSAAERRKMVAKLKEGRPELFARYEQAQAAADKALTYARESGEFPLTGKGDINTYMLFAELARHVVRPKGRVGLVLPSGVATDKTTREFFAALINSEALIALYDFENKAATFVDVHRSSKFCVLLFGGDQVQTSTVDFAFFAREMEDLADKRRHVTLSKKDIALLNPNTRTSPIFRSPRDAELTKAVYRRVSILIDHNRKEGGNPWGIKFVTMFHQTNDAEVFHTPEKLKKAGFKLEGNCWIKGKRTFLPLYEAKMLQAYDHRAASVIVQKGNWVRQGQTDETTPVAHANPEYVVLPRWWVDEKEVDRVLRARRQRVYLAYKDVTSATNRRTMIAAFIPDVAAVNSAPLVLTGKGIPPRLACCLLANLNSIPLDYVARQKVGGVHLNYFIVEQLPIFSPDRYADRCPWDKRQTLEKWISERVLKLSCTADDMRPLAEAADFDPPVHKWKDAERAELMAELDAAYFVLYGLSREDVEFVLTTFRGLDTGVEDSPSLLPRSTTIVDKYDELLKRSQGGA
ncbi:MAG: N-6 DNA methylase [Planctomycetia bacterium]|nr:N-6 DNA methylase [Planctomycetia bacterium]